MLHQGGQRPPQLAHQAPPPFYSPFAQTSLQQRQQQQGLTPPPDALRQAQAHELARQRSAQLQQQQAQAQHEAMARQHSGALAHQHAEVCEA